MIIHFNLWTLDDGGNSHLYSPFGERIQLYWNSWNINWITHYVGWILCKLSNPGACEYSTSRCLAMKCLLFFFCYLLLQQGLTKYRKVAARELAWCSSDLRYFIWKPRPDMMYDKNRLLDCAKIIWTGLPHEWKIKRKILSIWLQRLSLQRPL